MRHRPARLRQLTSCASRLLLTTAVMLSPASSMLAAGAAMPAHATGNPKHFQPMDVFQLEYAADPQISPDGSRIVYVRNFMDVMSDGTHSNLWMIDVATGEQRPLTSGNNSNFSPRWSPDGSKLLYVSTEEGGAQLWMRWMDTGQTAKISNLTASPGAVTWSPDGRWISMSMFVPGFSDADNTLELNVELPSPPSGATWAPPAKVISKMTYRADGAGYLPDGFNHLFVVPADGGSPRQLTSGDFNHFGHSWTPDSEHLVLAANRHDEWRYDPADSEIFELELASGEMRALTSRHGPDNSPQVSPDGSQILYTGNDETYQGYNINELYVMNRDGSGMRRLIGQFDRSVGGARWAADGDGIWFQYDDAGNTKVAFVAVAQGAEPEVVARDVGGLSIGRPYAGGQFSLSSDGAVAFTYSRPDHPADVALTTAGGEMRRLTWLNQDLLGHKQLGATEEMWWESSADGRRVQGWIVTPPDFDASKKYPMILEIHGGPFANYGDRFAAEIQLMAAAGYVVLYTNPRGSTSYGQEFGNLIHHNYPGEDYDDLISGVDSLIAKGYVDPDQLFVTGGSGGGVLTAWIVGHTNRFAAAVSAKPVINWYSFVLTADNPGFFYKYWFPGLPWDHAEQYLQRSPLHHVGNVTTPTMLLTGEQDYRTPISETEQFYAALQLMKVPTAMVRIPEASHGIASRPSNLISKVAHILAWFEKYRAHQGADDMPTNSAE